MSHIEDVAPAHTSIFAGCLRHARESEKEIPRRINPDDGYRKFIIETKAKAGSYFDLLLR